MGCQMNVSKAIVLLRDDNLVWSEDFDTIRHDLANLLGSLEALYQSANVLSSELTDEG
jgi:hypothetical protein